MNEEYERVQAEARQYEELENLVRQPGWKILLDHLNRVKETVMLALIVEKDYDKIITLQERIRAFDSLVQTVQSASSIKLKLFQELQEIAEDEKLRKEFDV